MIWSLRHEKGSIRTLLINRISSASNALERSFDYFRTVAPEFQEERAMLLEEWMKLDSSLAVLEMLSIMQKKLPPKVKRKRAIAFDDGTPTGYEEYYDYIFPDEAAECLVAYS